MRHTLPDTRPHPRLIIVGVGNPYRGDDGAGPLTAQLVRDQAAPGTEVTDCVEPIGLLTLWEGAAAAWIVDAAGPPAALTGPEAAGTVHRTTLVGGEPFLETGVASTHGLGIAHAIRIGQALADLPPLVVIYTITVHQLSATTWIHPQIASAARTVARAIVAETLAYRPVRASITADGPRAGGWADQL